MNETAHGKVWCERGEPKMEPRRTVIFHSWLYYGYIFHRMGLQKKTEISQRGKRNSKAGKDSVLRRRGHLTMPNISRFNGTELIEELVQ